MIKRLKKSKYINKIVILSYKSSNNINLIPITKKNSCEIFFFGDKENVLKRFFNASNKYKNYNQIIRITGDCTLSDPNLIDEMIIDHLNSNSNFTSNVISRTFPDGLDVEIFKRKLLQEIYKKVSSKFDKEHVTSWIVRNKKNLINNFSQKNDFSGYKISVDEFDDYKNLKFLIKKNKNNIFIDEFKIFNFIKKNSKNI